MRARVGTEGQRTVVTGDTKDVWSLGRECRGLRASFFPPLLCFCPSGLAKQREGREGRIQKGESRGGGWGEGVL